MDKYKVFKGVTTFIVGSGVGKITNAIVDAHIFPETTTQKVLVAAGKIGISMTAGAIVVAHVDHQIDEYRDAFKKIEAQVEEKQAQQTK